MIIVITLFTLISISQTLTSLFHFSIPPPPPPPSLLFQCYLELAVSKHGCIHVILSSFYPLLLLILDICTFLLSVVSLPYGYNLHTFHICHFLCSIISLGNCIQLFVCVYVCGSRCVNDVVNVNVESKPASVIKCVHGENWFLLRAKHVWMMAWE